MTITAPTTPETMPSTAGDAHGSDELAAVGAALDRAVGGRTTRIAVCGASGSGRTHLIERARRDAGRRSMRVLATHGRSGDADVPYASMLTLLHPVADRIPDLPTAERESLQAALDLRHADVDERAARTGLWRLLTRLGEEGPLLITADDSDVMDLASLDVLAFALGRMDSHPVAVLASAASPRASNPLVAIGDELIVLDGLDDGALVSAVLAAVPATDWVAGRISSFSGGNSTLAIQLVRSLTPDQRAGRVACPLVPIPPPEITRALTPILDSISAGATTALSVIAADTTDDVAVVRAAVGAVLDGRSNDPLAELEQAGIVSIVGATARTIQPMLDVVAYDRLGPSERRSVHRALAAAMRAPHHEAGRAWQMASGAEGPDTEVFAAMTTVARHATERGNLRRAAVAHQRAADFADHNEDRARALARALGCWTAVGDPIAMRRLMGETVEGGIVTHVAHSAAVRWLAGDAAAVPELRKAAPLASAEEQPLLDALFADAAMAAGHVREAMEAAERIVRDDRAGAGRNLAEALLVLGRKATPAVLSALTPASDDEAVEVVRSRAVLRLAEAHLQFGDAAAAEDLLGGATPTGPAPWDPVDRTAIRARIAMWRGQPEAARQVLGAALDALPAAASIARAVLLEVLAEVHFLLGDRESAMAALDDLLPVVRRAAMARREAAARSTVGRIAWSVGEVDIAASCLEQARRVDPSAPIGDLIALLSSAGRDDAARTWLGRVDTNPASESAPVDVLRARANVATEATGFHRAAAVLRGSQLSALEAELMVDLAAWNHRRKRWADVYEAAERAVRLCIPSGITGWIERLDRLEPPAAPAPTNVPAALAGLTEAERRVALAISRGLTNKEAAAELFVSVKTIDSHLQRIYPKLFVRSRGELAVLVNAAMTASGAPLGNSTGDPPDARR